MSWGLLMQRHATTLWHRLKVLWMTRGLERKERAARGVAAKRPTQLDKAKFRKGRGK